MIEREGRAFKAWPQSRHSRPRFQYLVQFENGLRQKNRCVPLQPKISKMILCGRPAVHDDVGGTLLLGSSRYRCSRLHFEGRSDRERKICASS